MAIPCWKTMPALVAGNTVVFKPSSETPHCATLLVELMDEAGFPPGTVNLVTGSGEAVGDAIVDSRDVPVISFTGSVDTGRGIAERAGRLLKRLSLELGGKNAVVVLRDADLDLAVDGILWSRVRDDGPAVHGLLAGDRGPAGGRRARARASRRGRRPCASATGCWTPRTSGRSSTPRRSTRSSATSRSAGREGELVTRRRAGARRRPRERPLLPADDLRAASSRWRGSPRRRSSGPCCRSSRSTTTTRR